jgi:Fe-S-cluster-containing dehydrogenase component
MEKGGRIMKTMIIDVDKCVGCKNCQLSCKDEHVGNDWSPIAKPQPENHFWLNVTETERGAEAKIAIEWVPVLCMHCEEPSCVTACSEGAIYKREDGIVIIDPEKCNGCKDCMNACPYNVIYFNDELNIGQKCTLCAHLLDRGWKEPRCVTACPTEAIVFGEIDALEELMSKTEEMKPEAGCKPAVKYIGLPKPFIAGEVYSPKEDACVEGAKVTLTNPVNGEVKKVLTDNYGDFWVKGLEANTYCLTIEKDGYYPKQMSNFKVTEDGLNAGAIKLYRRSSPI